MRLLDTDVRYFDDETPGIPPLTNEWGSTIALLDACLVTGSPEQEIKSINSYEDPEYPEVYWISKLLLNEGHGFKKDLSVIEIRGCEQEIYNSYHRVQEVTSDTITIAFEKLFVTEKPKDSVGGFLGMTVKTAPLGYTKVFEEPQKAVYKNATEGDNICYLRVDNACPPGYDLTWAKFSRVSIFNHMDYLDDYDYRPGRVKAPQGKEDYTEPESVKGLGASGKYGVSKWYQRVDYTGSTLYENRVPPTSSSGPGYWDLIGDNRTFYFFPAVVDGTSTNRRTFRACYAFGEYVDINNESNTNNHILCCHQHSDSANTHFGHYNSNPGYLEEKNTFSRLGYDRGNYMLNDSVTTTYLNTQSYKFTFESMTSSYQSISGTNRFMDYKVDPIFPIINLLPVYLKTDTKLLKGRARGYLFMATDILDIEKYGLKISGRDVLGNFISARDKKVVFLNGTYSVANSQIAISTFAFQLNNWE